MKILRSSPIHKSPRVKQLLGLFDVPDAPVSAQSWEVDLLDRLPADWSVGVIVGPSGCGKSTIARELFGAQLVEKWDWPADRSIVDGFPKSLGIKDITGLLSSVGFSSPPAWLRPFHVLSNGQQFRVNLARTLAQLPDLAVVDEFTSVVDRQVAQIGAAAVAKTVRRRKQKFIAVTCHYDVLDWLEPDWIYEPHTNRFEAADAARGALRRRPAINLQVVRTDTSVWKLFKGHHYLSADLHRASKCFVALIDGSPAAFTAVLSFPHPKKPGWREHRTVCLPDFQGVGIGNALSEFIASLFAATGKPYYSTSSHPSMIRHRCRSPLWRMTRKPGFTPRIGSTGDHGFNATTASERLSCSFAYMGGPNPTDAKAFGVI